MNRLFTSERLSSLGVVPSKLVPGARAAVTCAAPTPARYVAVYLGAGGYVPHAAEEVLRLLGHNWAPNAETAEQ